MSKYSLFVGIDIAARTASVAFAQDADDSGPAFEISQTKKGIAELKRRLKATGHAPNKTLIVIEATSNYWWFIALALHNADYPVSVINPARAHYFARATLKRAKSDRLDAQTLAQLAAALKLKLWTPPPDIQTELRQRLQQRADLRDARIQMLNRLHALRHHPKASEPVLQRFEEVADLLKKQIDGVDHELAELLRQDDAWNDTARRLMSVTGIGLITAAWLLCISNNFTSCERVEQLTSYVGLAPHVRQSGTSLNGRAYIGHTGNAELRKALYMAAVIATAHNPVIKAYYSRLKERGHLGKSALCACARKLLHICWAVGTKKTMFDPNYRQNVDIAAQKSLTKNTVS